MWGKVRKCPHISTLFPHIFHTFSSQKFPHISAGNWPDSSHGKCEEKCKENVRRVNVRKIVRKMGSSKMWGKMWGNFNTFFLTISLHYFLTWTLEIGRFPHMEMWGKCEENCEENFSTTSAHGFLTLRLEKILTFVRKSVRKTFHFPHISSQFQHIDASLESTVRKMAILDTMKCEKMVKPRPIKI